MFWVHVADRNTLAGEGVGEGGQSPRLRQMGTDPGGLELHRRAAFGGQKWAVSSGQWAVSEFDRRPSLRLHLRDEPRAFGGHGGEVDHGFALLHERVVGVADHEAVFGRLERRGAA